MLKLLKIKETEPDEPPKKMSKFEKCKQYEDNKPPPKKRSKVSREAKEGTQPRQQLKRSLRNKPKNINNLPMEILERIIGYVNTSDHYEIRATSKRLKEVNDLFVVHEFKRAYNKSITQNPSSYESAVFKSIIQATEVYVRSGFQSTFCGCILPILRGPFCPDISQINTFLVHFYNMIQNSIGDTTSQLSRLLYTITLMRFFKAFNNYTILSSTALPLHWQIVLELKGPWLGILWTSKNKNSNGSTKRKNLLVILTEMLIASIHGKSFKRVWESPSEIYVFGNDISDRKQVPRTAFTFTVYGSKKICSLFRSCLEDDSQQFVWPLKWPKNQFNVNLDIACNEAERWNCSKYQHMEFGPFPETSFNDAEEADEEDEYHYENSRNCHMYSFG